MRTSNAAVTGRDGGAEPTLAPRLRTLVLLRLGVVGAVLLLLLFTELFGIEPEADALTNDFTLSAPLIRAGYLLVTVLLADGVFAWALRHPWGRGRAAATAQVGVDLVLVTALVYVTHGPAASPLAVLYFGPVVAAALVCAPSVALATALASAGGLAAIDAVYIAASKAEGPLPLLGDPAPASLVWTAAGIGTLLAFGAAFGGVTFLGSTLAGRLSRARLLLDEVLQHLGEGVIAVDPAGRVAFANREAERWCGCAPDRRLAGRTLAAVLGDDAAPLDALVERGQGGPLQVDLPGGGDAVIEVTASPVHDDTAGRRGTVLMLRDVTLRREVARARAQAERLREVSEMSAGLAHEIRNPLASVRGSIQALMEGVDPTPTVRRLMELAISESDRLDGIITEFLEFAAMRGPRPARHSARGLFDEVALLVRARDLPPGITIDIRVPEGLAVWADGDQIRQVLLNLALNAVEAMRTRGGVLTFAAHGADRRGVRLSVHDTGVGVPQSDLPKLGTPFFSSRPQGTGLGLAIVHRIVGAHGGTVRIESTPDVGTTVTCTLPEEERAA